jgi:hypothetical protein
MRERLTADDLYSYILILRPVNRRIILVIEGDSDYTALRSHLDESEVTVIPGYGKPIIEPAMDLVNDNNIPNVIALLDRDFGSLLPGRPPKANVFLTDRYDLDATIFFSGSICERMAYSLGDREQIKDLLSDLDCSELTRAAANLAMVVGILRFISIRDGLNLKLRDFPLGEVVRDDCRSVDIEQLATLALKRVDNPLPKRPRELVLEIQAVAAQVSDPYAYCSGHDLGRALSVMLRKRGGVSLKPEIIERILRGAFGCTEMRGTQVYSEMARWANPQNRRIWRCDLAV